MNDLKTEALQALDEFERWLSGGWKDEHNISLIRAAITSTASHGALAAEVVSDGYQGRETRIEALAFLPAGTKLYAAPPTSERGQGGDWYYRWKAECKRDNGPYPEDGTIVQRLRWWRPERGLLDIENDVIEAAEEIERLSGHAPAAYRQWSTKFNCWEYQDNAEDLRKDTEREPLYAAPKLEGTAGDYFHANYSAIVAAIEAAGFALRSVAGTFVLAANPDKG